MTTYDEERIADLLRLLKPAPEAWVKAAQELPPASRKLDEIVEKARADAECADAEFRRALIADLEAALAAEGYVPDPQLRDAVRRRLDSE
jgi:hypothetical protein